MSYKYNPLEGILEHIDDSVYDRINNIESVEFKISYYAEITTTSGQISIPTEATILLDQWANGVDAVLSAIPGGTGTKPDYEDTGKVFGAYLDFEVGGDSVRKFLVMSPDQSLIYDLYIKVPRGVFVKHLEVFEELVASFEAYEA